MPKRRINKRGEKGKVAESILPKIKGGMYIYTYIHIYMAETEERSEV